MNGDTRELNRLLTILGRAQNVMCVRLEEVRTEIAAVRLLLEQQGKAPASAASGAKLKHKWVQQEKLLSDLRATREGTLRCKPQDGAEKP